MKQLENKVFDQLPLLLAVPRAAAILGISRASAYRLVATGELPSRRLGGRVYVVTAALRELVAASVIDSPARQLNSRAERESQPDLLAGGTNMITAQTIHGSSVVAWRI